MSKFVGSEAAKLPVKTPLASNVSVPIWSNPSWNSAKPPCKEGPKSKTQHFTQTIPKVFLLTASCRCTWRLCVRLCALGFYSLWPWLEPSAPALFAQKPVKCWRHRIICNLWRADVCERRVNTSPFVFQTNPLFDFAAAAIIQFSPQGSIKFISPSPSVTY